MLPLVFTLLACNPGVSPPETGSPDDTGGDDGEVVVLEPTHDAHMMPLWQDACRGCHTSAFPFGGLDLTDAYDELVGVPSEQSALVRIAPSNVEASYLWHKVNGTASSVGGSGARMPDGGRPELSEVQLQNLRNWIEQGAPQ